MWEDTGKGNCLLLCAVSEHILECVKAAWLPLAVVVNSSFCLPISVPHFQSCSWQLLPQLAKPLIDIDFEFTSEFENIMENNGGKKACYNPLIHTPQCQDMFNLGALFSIYEETDVAFFYHDVKMKTRMALSGMNASARAKQSHTSVAFRPVHHHTSIYLHMLCY